jgi:hypothetical protein
MATETKLPIWKGMVIEAWNIWKFVMIVAWNIWKAIMIVTWRWCLINEHKVVYVLIMGFIAVFFSIFFFLHPTMVLGGLQNVIIPNPQTFRGLAEVMNAIG